MLFRAVFSVLLIIILFPGSGYSQYATAVLDPTIPAELPSAASWRFGSTLGFEHIHYNAGAGEEKEEGNPSVNMHSTGTAYLLAFQPSKVSFELYGTTEYKQVFVDATNDSDITSKKSRERFNLAVRGEDSLSIGLSSGKNTFEKTGYVHSEEYSSLSGSISMRLYGALYVAYGIEHVQDKTTERASNTWANNHFAVSMMFGNPSTNQYRFEYSTSLSPESTQGDATSDNRSYKLKSQTDRFTLEMVVDRWFVSYTGINVSVSSYDNLEYLDDTFVYMEETSGFKSEKMRVGFGYKTMGGMFYGGYYTNHKITIPLSVGYKERNLTEYSFNIGYSFF